MRYLLMEEYEEMKVYALDNVIYHKIEKKVIMAVGGNEMIGKKLMDKFMLKTVKELSCNSMFNIMDCFEILA